MLERERERIYTDLRLTWHNVIRDTESAVPRIPSQHPSSKREKKGGGGGEDERRREKERQIPVQL